VQICNLLNRLLRRYGADNSDLRPSLPFPVLPYSDDELWMGAWSTEETQFVLVQLRTLLEYGAVFGRWNNYGWPGSDDEWNSWVRSIAEQFLRLEEYEQPSVVSFIG
jgi:hypothetical protein